MKLSREEVFAASEDGSHIESRPIKYGTLESYIFNRDGVYYRMDIEATDDGWQVGDGVEAYRVRGVEKKVVDWVRVE